MFSLGQDTALLRHDSGARIQEGGYRYPGSQLQSEWRRNPSYARSRDRCSCRGAGRGVPCHKPILQHQPWYASAKGHFEMGADGRRHNGVSYGNRTKTPHLHPIHRNACAPPAFPLPGNNGRDEHGHPGQSLANHPLVAGKVAPTCNHRPQGALGRH